MPQPGLTVTRAGRSVRFEGEGDGRMSLESESLMTLLIPGDNLQNDAPIAAGHPGVTFMGSAPNDATAPPSAPPFSGQGHRLG